VAINDDRDALTQAGRHADAARLAAAAGDHAGAAVLWERIWEFVAAAGAWDAAGDVSRALGAAIAANDGPLMARYHEQLLATAGGAAAAFAVYVRNRRHGPAARLAESLGDGDRAIELYQRAHLDLDAARLLAAAGRDREAARLLERALELANDDERAEIGLQLGRIYSGRGTYELAVRHLQDATRSPAVAIAARRVLVVALAGLGLAEAARETLRQLRTDDPSVTAELSEYLRQAQAQRPVVVAREREVIAGRYRLDGLLGAGASGRVFRAVDESTGRVVAIKMYFAANARGSAGYERFLREARVAAGLRHPGLVDVYDASLDHGFLVMEFLPGGSLAQRLAAGETFGGAQVRRLGLELLAGLEVAHHRGVVHRDIKPANVFFDGRGSAKLGDFGVAHLIDLGQTQTGGLIGSLAYMSPEQITGAAITITADMYGLGVTLFEALTGRLPFLGPDFVAQHLGEPAPEPSAVAAQVAPTWDPILARLLAKSPNERYSSISAVRAGLTEIQLGDRSGPSVVIPRPRRDSGAATPAGTVDDEPVPLEGRYQFESPCGATAWSRLSRAVDVSLDRSVVIERFDDSPTADRAIAWLRSLARANSPFVQRALAYDRATRTVVFEAATGVGLATGAPTIAITSGVRLLKRLARACAAIHMIDRVHGSINTATVVIADEHIPIVMIAGVEPPGAATARTDVDGAIALVAQVMSNASTGDPARVIIDALSPGLTVEIRSELTAGDRHDGESLYAWADALEIAHLRSR
jgi:eukaryotic-like serine/threonine-protein kinase